MEWHAAQAWYKAFPRTGSPCRRVSAQASVLMIAADTIMTLHAAGP